MLLGDGLNCVRDTLIWGALGDVGLGDDTDQPVTVDDREPPNLMSGHRRQHFRDRVVRSGRTLTVCQIEVFVERDGQETLCALMQQTVIRMAGRPDTGPA